MFPISPRPWVVLLLVLGGGCGIVDIAVGDLAVPTSECAEPFVFRGIGAGDDHVCGIDLDGSLWCWGQNEDGQIGDGTETHRDRPVPVSLPAPVRAIGGGDDHTCVALETGALFCWGSDGSGELGLGDAHVGRSEAAPVAVESTASFARIDSFDHHTCAIADDGSLWCWGNNGDGQLGVGDIIDHAVPTRVGDRTDWIELGVGQRHTCGITADAILHCWGANNGQQLGVVGDEDRLTPQSLTGSWETVALGASSTCAVDTDGSLWCWGANDDGQLGVGDVLPRASPERVGDGQGWVGAALAVGFGCAFDVDGALFCMGEARRLGREEASLVPVPIATGGPVEDAVAGKNHGCVLRRDGVAVCWGENDDGEVATGDRLERAVPSEVCQP